MYLISTMVVDSNQTSRMLGLVVTSAITSVEGAYEGKGLGLIA
jgi:hypothetical protein